MRSAHAQMSLRRGLFAVLVTCTVFVMLAAVLGFAAADASTTQAASLPAEWGLPDIHEGDRGEYVAFRVNQSIPEEERTVVQFDVGPLALRRDALGWLHRVIPVHVSVNNSYDPDPMPPNRKYDDRTFDLDATTRKIVSYGSRPHLFGGGFSPVLSAVQTSRAEALWDITTSIDPDGPDVRFPCCGIVNPLQGESWPGQLPVRFPPSTSPWMPGDSYQLVAASSPYFAMEGPGSRVVFDSRVPYPVRIEREEGNGSGALWILRLANFTRGERPVEQGTVAPNRAPDVTMAPLTFFGPDETGFPNPFPLKDAVLAARDDPLNSSLKDYFATHTGAVLQSASLQIDEVAEGLVSQWRFTYSDGVEAVGKCIRGFVPNSTQGGTQRPIVVIRQFPLFERCFMDLHPQLPPSLPTEVPTVSSMANRWVSFASDEYRGKTPNQWDYSVGCADETCAEADVRLSAGFVGASDAAGAGPSGVTQSQQGGSSSHSAWPGRASLTVEVRLLVNSTIGPPMKAVDNGSLVALSAFPAVPWLFPPAAYVAAAGLAALVAGALYWIWPWARQTLSFPLFTRLEPARALEQPVRARIASLIEASPGIHFQAITRHLNLGNGVTEYHLRKLIHFGIVIEQLGNRFACYFPKGRVDRRVMAAIPMLKWDGPCRVLDAAIESPRSTASEIARRSGLDPGTVSYHLRRLSSLGLLETIRTGREVHVTATEFGKQARTISRLEPSEA